MVCTSAGYVLEAKCKSWGKEAEKFWLSLKRILRKELFCLPLHHVKLYQWMMGLSQLSVFPLKVMFSEQRYMTTWSTHSFPATLSDHFRQAVTIFSFLILHEILACQFVFVSIHSTSHPPSWRTRTGSISCIVNVYGPVNKSCWLYLFKQFFNQGWMLLSSSLYGSLKKIFPDCCILS